MVNTFVQRVAAVTAEKTLSVTLESLLEASKEDEQYQELFEKLKRTLLLNVCLLKGQVVVNFTTSKIVYAQLIILLCMDLNLGT